MGGGGTVVALGELCEYWGSRTSLSLKVGYKKIKFLLNCKEVKLDSEKVESRKMERWKVRIWRVDRWIVGQMKSRKVGKWKSWKWRVKNLERGRS